MLANGSPKKLRGIAEANRSGQHQTKTCRLSSRIMQDHADSVSYEDIEDPLTLGFDHLELWTVPVRCVGCDHPARICRRRWRKSQRTEFPCFLTLRSCVECSCVRLLGSQANHSISETSDLWHGRWRQHQERPWSLGGARLRVLKV